MAAIGNSSRCWGAPEVYSHHEQKKVCISRPKYREGRRARAVKVYTINLESRYVMVQGVPAIGVMSELIQLCALYGVVEEYRPLDEYPAEEFTEVYLVKFQKLTSARAAKRHMDEKSFYGGVLHVCYVPEYESVEDTRHKLQDRKRYILRSNWNKAREKKEKVNKETRTLDVATTSGKIASRDSQNSVSSDAVEGGGYPNFPLLPLPHPESLNLHWPTPTEDKMGTLHNAIMETKRPVNTLRLNSSQKDMHGHEVNVTPHSHKASAVRFVPRPACLENRKRKMEEEGEEGASLIGVDRQEAPLIGPKLPEPPKVDMEDESLNQTVNIIRNTMRKVTAAPDLKPAEKKIKPRRRI